MYERAGNNEFAHQQDDFVAPFYAALWFASIRANDGHWLTIGNKCEGRESWIDDTAYKLKSQIIDEIMTDDARYHAYTWKASDNQCLFGYNVGSDLDKSPFHNLTSSRRHSTLSL